MATQNQAMSFQGSQGRSPATVDIEEARAIQQVQAAMIVAKKFPRDPLGAMDKIIKACTRPSLAETALYSYSKGGSEVTGPSIRLAETLAQCWGNIDFGIRELSQSNGESTVEAYAWDMETNTRQTKIFQVPHKRFTRNGSYELTDPREIYETVANSGARRLRACILGVIPGDVIEAAVRQCELTSKNSADTTNEGVKKLQEAFEQYDVTAAMIEKRIQCKLFAIRPPQVVQLRKIYASLRDGMSTVADWFEVSGDQSKPEGTTPKVLPPLPDGKVKEYRAMVDSGKKTAEQVIAMVGSKYSLTDEQKNAIMGPPWNEETNIQEDGNANS